MKRNDGQSMEDILASIRTIIADGGIPEEAVKPGSVADAFADDGEPGEAPAFDDADEPESRLLELARITREASGDDLLSQEAREAASESMSVLEGTLIRNYPGSENTLDGVVKDLLRPLLKEWLDANLPMVVERMVAREISRIKGE